MAHLTIFAFGFLGVETGIKAQAGHECKSCLTLCALVCDGVVAPAFSDYNRLVDVPMVTKQQITDGKRAVASAIASLHLEGIAPDCKTLADQEHFVQGGQEITDVLIRMKKN